MKSKRPCSKRHIARRLWCTKCKNKTSNIDTCDGPINKKSSKTKIKVEASYQAPTLLDIDIAKQLESHEKTTLVYYSIKKHQCWIEGITRLICMMDDIKYNAEEFDDIGLDDEDILNCVRLSILRSKSDDEKYQEFYKKVGGTIKRQKITTVTETKTETENQTETETKVTIKEIVNFC